MASLNKVMIIGNLTRDPEVRYTPKGTAVAEVGVACNRNWTGDNGERREEVTYIDVTLWGRQAELAGQYLQRGRSVYFEGRLQLDSWEDKNTGQRRSKLRVVAEQMQFLGNRGDNQGGGGGGGGYQQQGPPQQSQQPQGGGGGYQQQQPPQQQQHQQPTPPPQQQQQPQGPPPQQQAPPSGPAELPEEDDDIPF